MKHVGPELYVIDSNNIDNFHYESSLAPDRLQADLHGQLTGRSTRLDA